jgi:hypothetical protein
VRTFPKELAEFRTIVEDRGARLRQLPFAELKQLGNQPAENVTVESRKATIGIIVLALQNGGIQVVLHRDSWSIDSCPGRA